MRESKSSRTKLLQQKRNETVYQSSVEGDLNSILISTHKAHKPLNTPSNIIFVSVVISIYLPQKTTLPQTLSQMFIFQKQHFNASIQQFISIPASVPVAHHINFLKQNHHLVSINWSLQHVDLSSPSFVIILSIKKNNLGDDLC